MLYAEFVVRNENLTKKGIEIIIKKDFSLNNHEGQLIEAKQFSKKQKINLEKNYDKIRDCQKKYKQDNLEKINARRRELREKRKIYLNEKEKIRRKNDPLFNYKQRISQKKWRDAKKIKLKPQTDAHKLVFFAIKLGLIVKPENCSECGVKTKLEGHHEDYKKPLDVVWLCKLCHQQRHRKYEIP